MQNRDLRTLREIARLGSFSGAAARLNMTPSAVSMQMKALEAELGTALFDRQVRPPRLTPFGRRASDAAGAVLSAEAALRRLAAHDDPVTGRFALGLVPSASVRLVPRFLRDAPRALPHARFEFRSDISERLETEVGEGRLDAAVVTATGVPRGQTRHTLLERDPLLRAEPVDAADGARALPFLHFAPSTGIGRLIAAELPRHRDLAKAPRVVLDSVQTILACLDAGSGRTILPRTDLVRAGAPMRLAPTRSERRLVLVTRADTPLDAAVDRLASLLLPSHEGDRHDPD